MNKYLIAAWVTGYVAFGLYFAHHSTYVVTISGQEVAAAFWTKFVFGALLLPALGVLGILLSLPFIFLFFQEREEQEKKNE